jgi:hypothetical protein
VIRKISVRTGKLALCLRKHACISMSPNFPFFMNKLLGDLYDKTNEFHTDRASS